MTSFPDRLAQAVTTYHAPPPFGGESKVRILEELLPNQYRYDPERDGYWVQAEAFVPYDEIDPGPSTTYVVWVAEQCTTQSELAPDGAFPGPWVWSADSQFTCDVVDPQRELDEANASARRLAHDYARYLRDTYPCAYVAVRPAGQQPLPIRQDP